MAPDPTVRHARARFFASSGFPTDGGYDDDWSEAAFGPVRYRVPNTLARRAALRRHDLHHVATGYAADWRGEAEISGWELGSGAGVYPYAWLIALWGMFTGLLYHPAPTVRAFLRGRHSDNLYCHGSGTEAVLSQPVSTLQQHLSVLPASIDPWTGRSGLARIADALALAAWSLLSLTFGVVSLLPAGLLIALAWRPTLPSLCCSGAATAG
ncbi:MAG: hypothetical protein ACI8RZ_002327 [Myxococcota bacterium]|jgi:hypothetical protein